MELGPPRVRVAGVILYREGRVLLQHRDDRPDIVYPGAWAIFGGHVEADEDPETAARREIEEELGLRLDGPLDLVARQELPGRQRTIFAAPLPVPPDQLTLHEGQGMALLSRADLAAYNVVPSHREVLERFLDRLTR
ncbi:MAG TPA: NUDIX domain-containing protein [Armatimonadota bacterium]|nr:NUDIX domain-containing protein [Armatimonadota bacterium]